MHLLPDEASENSPGETLRALRQKEDKQFGDHLIRPLVLETWERLAEEEHT